MRALLAFTIAILPGLVAWWMGRGLIRLRHDPALPERLVAHRSRLPFVVAIPIGLLVYAAPDHMVWAVPLTIVALLIHYCPVKDRINSFTDAFGRARMAIARREETERLTPSNSQISVGAAMRAKLNRLERRLSRRGGD